MNSRGGGGGKLQLSHRFTLAAARDEAVVRLIDVLE